MGKLINPIINKYTAIPNSIFKDQNLDYKCRGVLGTLISLPDGWNFSTIGLCAIVKGDGKASVRAALQKLEELGYLERISTKDQKGLFAGYDYKISIPPVVRKSDDG
ncbi:MAG: helix-turn-helix domain-containing protein [Firmicutes bacterium]|nr:helix-turn-helix domain-containing protein [Bacillota bacterium]